MSSSQFILLVLALVDLALSGLISNGFILTVILREWKKNRSLASSDQLILSLVLSNLGATLFMLPLFINDYIFTIFTMYIAYLIMYPLSDYLILSRHWFTAWLCVFYCLKIVKSSHSLFLWFKLKISWLIPRLIAGTLVLSLFLVFSLFFPLLRDVRSNMTIINPKSRTEMSQNHTVDVPKILFLIAGSGSPLLVILVCSILVVASLCKHVYRMKCKEHHSRSIQTKAHIKAAGTVVSILFLYISFYMVQTLATTVTMRKTEGTFLPIVVIAYPSAQAYILLLVNPKLNQAVNQMLPRRVN